MNRISPRITEFESMIVDEKEVNLKIEHRVDAFFPFYHTTISSERANRPKKVISQQRDAQADILEKHTCFFEPVNDHQTPKPREYHTELACQGYTPLSVPNKYPYAVHGKVNCFAPHEHKYLDLLDLQDWRNYLAISVKNARALRTKGYSAMFNIINFGRTAGGTQAHPHSQDGVLSQDRFSLVDEERNQFSQLERSQEDPFQNYFEYLRKQSLVCFETDEVFTASAFAPRFPDQIDIYAKRPHPHFLQLNSSVQDDFSRALYHAVHFLSKERGVTDLNLITHQDNLESRSQYRMHFHIFPRNKNIIAGVEIGFSGYVIDTWPEETAKEFRNYFEKLPEEQALYIRK